MITTGSQRKNDCAIVALSNYFGLDYDNVQMELMGIRVTQCNKWPKSAGIYDSETTEFCKRRGLRRVTSIPRRGQDKIDGLVRLQAQSNLGHLIILKNGIVYDAFYPQGIDLASYRKGHKKNHISDIWCR